MITETEDAFERLASQVAEKVVTNLEAVLYEADERRWMDSREAAGYLGISRNALHKLTSARKLAFSQTCEGAPLFFKRSDLDAYRNQFKAEALFRG